MTPDAAAVRPSRVGQSLEGGYSLEERIGAGSLGETYRAKHVEHQRVVVVKLLHDDVSSDALRRSRFAWEAATLGGLSHPNVPPLLDYGVHAGRRYFVREWMEGESLEQRLERGPIPLDAALVIIRQLLAALAAVHSSRLLHRNLRPSNLFLEKRKQGRERLRLLDFAPASRRPHVLDSPFTPPECLAGEPGDARSDVFAVGAILSAMLRATGTLEPRVRVLTPVDLMAEPAADAIEPAEAEASAEPEPSDSKPPPAATPSEPPQTFPLGMLPDDRGRARLGPDSALQRWLRRALSPDRNRRFADAAAMLQELIDLLPRELRSPGEDQAAAARPPSAASPLAAAPAPAPASPPLIAEPPKSAAMNWLAPAPGPAVKL
ncbi:MAG TPA: serine/threonine-protein kinase, partial [Polyangiales bacterium]|nr:serine/threonine-protein kinase [Polyangiales bacterium]